MYAPAVRFHAVAVVGLIALVAGAAGAQPARAPADKPDWRGTGGGLKLLPPPSGLHAPRPVIVLQHDPIPGPMEEAMTMPFIAASTPPFPDLRESGRAT